MNPDGISPPTRKSQPPTSDTAFAMLQPKPARTLVRASRHLLVCGLSQEVVKEDARLFNYFTRFGGVEKLKRILDEESGGHVVIVSFLDTRSAQKAMKADQRLDPNTPFRASFYESTKRVVKVYSFLKF
ncbi:hypothetical protein WR25_04430 [Diploscapter pachys]|uniref:RRM domain-containing protein n=1 Tax=Diploscapter pachys TaxID=2018661 RepID=A0A2A2LG68_9BILA|nr:hypothetical protein WR25_04430 [Diploscapter pachys]